MVKVLSQAAGTTSQVSRHMDYVSREGELDLETDDGWRLSSPQAGAQLVADWNLYLPAPGSAEAATRGDRRKPRLVHKLVFSMPRGTPPKAVLGAVRAFAREEFGLKHRYVMALHTDEPHPHVHLIVKAVSEEGVRLNIRKQTLRCWRAAFAAHLRARGVDANATERAVRGSTHQNRKTGIYRAAERGESTFLRQRASAFQRAPHEASARERAIKAQLLASRREVEEGWWYLAEVAHRSGLQDVARDITRFIEYLPRVRTDREIQAGRPRKYYFEDLERSRLA